MIIPRRRQILKALASTAIFAPAIILGGAARGSPPYVVFPQGGDSNSFSGINADGSAGYNPAIDVTNNLIVELRNAPTTLSRSYITIAMDQFAYNNAGPNGVPSLSANPVVNTGGIGPGLTFMRDGALGVLNPPGYGIMIVAQGVGGTGMSADGTGYWGANFPGPGEGGLAALVRRVTAALALNNQNILGPMLWTTGANDANGGVSQSNYTTQFAAAIAFLRANIPGASNMIVLIQPLVPAYVASNPSQFGPVSSALAAMPSNVSKCGYVDPTAPGLSGNILGVTGGADPVVFHLTAGSQRLIGNPGFMNAYNSRSS